MKVVTGTLMKLVIHSRKKEAITLNKKELKELYGPYVYEHILNWEKAHGYPVPKGSIIHHLNGIRDDNRSENLALTSRKNHESLTLVKALQKRIRELEERVKELEVNP